MTPTAGQGGAGWGGEGREGGLHLELGFQLCFQGGQSVGAPCHNDQVATCLSEALGSGQADA